MKMIYSEGYDPAAAFNDGFKTSRQQIADSLRILALFWEKRALEWSNKASEHSRNHSKPRHHKAAQARSIVYQKCAIDLREIAQELEADDG